MALVNNGVKVSLKASQKPTGYSLPSVTTFTDYEYTRPMTLNVAKATVENATKATTLTNIISNATIGISKQVDDIMTADYIGSNTVTYYIDLLTINHNIAPN